MNSHFGKNDIQRFNSAIRDYCRAWLQKLSCQRGLSRRRGNKAKYRVIWIEQTGHAEFAVFLGSGFLT